MKAINYWMAHGVRIPGWLLTRAELSLEAKILYGVLLDEQDHWRNNSLQDKRPTTTHPLWNASEFAKILSWERRQVEMVCKELVDNDLVFIGHYETDEKDVIRFDLIHHLWMEAIYKEVPDEDT